MEEEKRGEWEETHILKLINTKSDLTKHVTM